MGAIALPSQADVGTTETKSSTRTQSMPVKCNYIIKQASSGANGVSRLGIAQSVLPTVARVYFLGRFQFKITLPQLTMRLATLQSQPIV